MFTMTDAIDAEHTGSVDYNKLINIYFFFFLQPNHDYT